MSDEVKAVKLVGKPASARDKFFLDWGLESLKAAAPALDETLGRLVTLDTALVGGGFVAAKGDVIPAGWSVAVLALLGASLGFALWGVSPRGGDLDLLDPDAVRDAEYGAIARKAAAVDRSMVALLAAFAVALAGVGWSQAHAPAVPAAIPLVK